MAAAASAVAAVALAVAVAGRSCQVDENTPEAAVRDFAAAASADDREAMYELLGPETRARLQAAAQRATDLVGGSQRYSALDMISIGKSPEALAPKDFVVATQDPSHAVVESVDATGEGAQIVVVSIDGRWRIELPAYGDPL